MRYLIAMLFVAGTATVADAQQAGLSVPVATPYDASNNVVRGSYGWLWSDDETPTMKHQKLRRAVALQQRAQALMTSNGGFLTADQQREIRREARAIVTGSRWR
jgi:hypothetical protein